MWIKTENKHSIPVPYWARMLDGWTERAVAGSTGPSRSSQRCTPFSACSSNTSMGPDVINVNMSLWNKTHYTTWKLDGVLRHPSVMSTCMPRPPWRPAVTLTFDLQNLIRSPVGASKYHVYVSSRLLKPFMRHHGLKICPDKWKNEQTDGRGGRTAQ